jgi:predicted RNase H-like nuclease (RuvC/YqgF family)
MDVFLNKLENVIEKFYKSQSDMIVLQSELKEDKEKLKELQGKIKDIEFYIEILKRKNTSTESIWASGVDLTVKIIYMLVVTYILYLIGWDGGLEISP